MRVLRLLLWLLPAEFRNEYGREILDTASDQWAAVDTKTGLVGGFRFWGRQWGALLLVRFRLRRCKTAVIAHVNQTHPERAVSGGALTDVRHAARALFARPGFTLVAVLTLGLGVGAATAMFSTVHTILFRALPYDDAHEVLVITQTDARTGSAKDGASAANILDVSRWSQSVSHVAVAEAHGLRLIDDGRALSLRGFLVSEGFFEALGVTPALGRGFRPEEFVSGNEKVVLLSHRTWRSRFGGDPDIVGRLLPLDGKSYSVIGVLPEALEYPADVELWGPRPPQPHDEAQRARPRLDAVARLASGVTVSRAREELDGIAVSLAARHPDANEDLGFRVVSLRTHLFGDVRAPLFFLLGAVGLVLLTAAANVAGLQVARGAGRSREYALRGALGASSWRVVRLGAVESLLLAVGGGVTGIGISYLGVRLIRALAPVHLPRIDELQIDGTVLGFAVVATVVSALVAGALPAFRSSKLDLSMVLGEGARGSSTGARAGSLRDRLVVTQIAAALMLTVGAALLLRSFDRLHDNELGFDPEGRLVLQVWAYDDDHRGKLEFFRRAVEEIRSVQGVLAVGLTSNLPFADDRSVSARARSVRFTIDSGPVPPSGEERVAGLSFMDEGYAGAMGIPIVSGRSFSSRDRIGSHPVVMINETFARRYFPEGNPVGERLTLHGAVAGGKEIVGVLADVRREGYESLPVPEVYLSLSQEPSNGLTFVVQTAASPTSRADAIQEAMWAADSHQATWATRPMTELVGDWTRHRRFNTLILLAFAIVSVCLAAIGVYALMAYSVEQRLGELGIRRALGGQTRQILRMVLGSGLKLALVGAGFGSLGALGLASLLRGMLFGIDPFELTTYVLMSLLVIFIALLAALVPALRATRVDPMVALRLG